MINFKYPITMREPLVTSIYSMLHVTSLSLQAQKPWEKKYTKLMAAKKDYHAACRSEKSTANQENNARGDSAVSPDQVIRGQGSEMLINPLLCSQMPPFSLVGRNGFNLTHVFFSNLAVLIT